MENVYLILSKNNFQSYNLYPPSNNLLEKRNDLSIAIGRLSPGDYSFFIFARDYANNTNIFYDNTFRFSIPKPVIDYILPVSIIVIIMIAGISCYVLFKSMKDYPFVNMKFKSW